MLLFCRLLIVHLVVRRSVSILFVSLQRKEEVVSKRCHFFSLTAPIAVICRELRETETCLNFIVCEPTIHALCENIVGQSDGALPP